MLNGALRAAGSLLWPAGARARLPILIYHRVLRQPDALLTGDPDAGCFGWQMRLLAEQFHPLPLREAADRLRQASLPARAVCVTFDDGYADNHDVALPILRQHGIPATFFVATRFLDGGCMWNDLVIEGVRRAQGAELDLTALGMPAFALAGDGGRKAALGAILQRLKYLAADERLAAATKVLELAGAQPPRDIMMRSSQVAALHAAGMEIGGHTASHPILARLGDAAARAEIAEGRARLEAIIGAPVRLFAYPNGRPREDYAARDVALVREAGFQAAVSTAWGTSTAHSDPCQLARFTPWDRTPLRFLLRLMRYSRVNAQTV